MPQATAPFPWPGSKGRQADWITSMFPHHDTFVDVFGGGGSLLFQKKPASTDIYNDADPDLVQFMRTLKERPADLIERLNGLPYARDLHNQWAQDYFNGIRPDDPIERAARYYFVRRTQFGGDAASQVGFRDTVDGRRHAARQWQNSLDRLPEYADRLQSVKITCRDYADVLSDAKYWSEGTLLYCDPPYRETVGRYDIADESTTNDGPAGNRPTFGFSRFARLIGDRSDESPPPFLAISTDTVPDELSHLNQQTTETHHGMQTGAPTEATEYLLTNYDPKAVPTHAESQPLQTFVSRSGQ